MTQISMCQPALSIIIPTHARSEILRECLLRIGAQTVRAQIEVIVVSDVVDPEVQAYCTALGAQVPCDYIQVSPCHQGVARNTALKRAKAPLCLIIGDDIFLEPDACAVHMMSHDLLTRQGVVSAAVLGFTTWDPTSGITQVMRWLERSGWQFGYLNLRRYERTFVPVSMQHFYTYTSHVSLPTAIARKYPFRQDIDLYGWEDVEWGTRLRDAGIGLFYQPDARAFHFHHMDLPASLRRMETLGTSAAQMARKVPDFDRLPRGTKRFFYRLVSMFPTMTGAHRRAFLRGVVAAERAADA